MAKLTAYEIYKKAQKENLTHEQYKQLLLDNGIIIKKVSEGKNDDTEQGALPIFDVSGSTSIYKYGIPTLINNTDEDPCDKCKYIAFSKQHKKICAFCERNLALNQYYR